MRKLDEGDKNHSGTSPRKTTNGLNVRIQDSLNYSSRTPGKVNMMSEERKGRGKEEGGREEEREEVMKRTCFRTSIIPLLRFGRLTQGC